MIFFKPTIKAKLVANKSKAKVSVKNSTPEDTMIMLFTIIKQVAKSLKMSDRQLMNKIIDLDKQVVRNTKKQAKFNKYGK